MKWDLLVQLLVNGLIVGMLYGVVAMCFTLIYKSTQVVNFAQGEFLVLGAWICWYFIVKWQLPFVAAFAFALVFTRQVEAAYTGLAMVAYAASCFLTGTVHISAGNDFKLLVMRLIVIAAMGFLGNYYFRIQRDRLARASRSRTAA